METKVDRKNKYACGTGESCYVHEPARACTCGAGEPCCVYEAEKGEQKETKMYGGRCESNCGPDVCK